MRKNLKKANTITTLLIVLITGIIIYFLIPKSFWDDVGSKNFKSPSHVGSTSTNSGGPTPGALRFNDPFKYDNYKPTKKDDFLKEREKNKKNSDGGSLYWK